MIIFSNWRFARAVPILMYHRIADIAGDRNSVSPKMFEQQLAYLKKKCYNTISLSDLEEHFTNGKTLPSKPLILTFDDGYEDNFITALPLLNKYGMKGTVFPVAAYTGRHNDWENYQGKPNCKVMNWEQLRIWKEAGMEIGSHTMNHPILSSLTPQEIEYELAESKRLIEERVGVPVQFLCYPYGDFDTRVRKIAQSLGYQGGVAIFEGVSLRKNDLWALRRVVISCRQPMWEFKLKVSPWHLVFIGMRILERKIKKWSGK